ncbi:MAG: hypothetical protein ACFB0A_00480 [Croceivirga sp.]
MKKYIFLLLFSVMFSNITMGNTIKKTNVITAVKDEYKKVDSSELTPAVVEQILKEYPTSKLGGVYKNSRGQFKLIMVLQSGSRRTVYIDQYGRWFTPQR